MHICVVIPFLLAFWLIFGSMALRGWCCVEMPSPPMLCKEGEPLQSVYLGISRTAGAGWLQWLRRCSQRWKALITTAPYASLQVCWTCAMKDRRWSWSLITWSWLQTQLGTRNTKATIGQWLAPYSFTHRLTSGVRNFLTRLCYHNS